jgi:hypothetical protein
VLSLHSSKVHFRLTPRLALSLFSLLSLLFLAVALVALRQKTSYTQSQAASPRHVPFPAALSQSAPVPASPPPADAGLSAALAVLSADPSDADASALLGALFAEWAAAHGREYEGGEGGAEHGLRRAAWTGNLLRDARYEGGGARRAPNGLSDMLPAEFLAISTGRASAEFEATTNACDWWDLFCRFWMFLRMSNVLTPDSNITFDGATFYANGDLPSVVDWREVDGVVGAVVTQGACGGCWAIAAAGAAKAALFLEHGRAPPICSAEIVACDGSSYGCQGGWPQNAFEYLAEKGSGVWLEDETCLSLSHDDVMDLLGEYDSAAVCDTIAPGGTYGGDSDIPDGIKGYAYANTPCACYTSGYGCSCSKQGKPDSTLNS